MSGNPRAGADDAATSFAALPVRAIGDGRLSSLDLRVLACIAFHDRMSLVTGKGQGCWAGHESMAKKVGCHYTRLSTAITRLGKFGYIQREAHPLNKRLRVYRVFYDRLPSGKGLPDAEPSPDTGTVGETANVDPDMVCVPFREEHDSEQESDVEYISLSDERYSAEARKDTPLEEAALACGAAGEESRGKVGKNLAKFERAFRHEPNKVPLPIWAPYLLQAWEDFQDDPQIGPWAERLFGEATEAMTLDEYDASQAAANARWPEAPSTNCSTLTGATA